MRELRERNTKEILISTGPDTSSFGAFIVSLLSPTDPKASVKDKFSGSQLDEEAIRMFSGIPKFASTVTDGDVLPTENKKIWHQKKESSVSLDVLSDDASVVSRPEEDWERCSEISASLGGAGEWEFIGDESVGLQQARSLELCEPSSMLTSASTLQLLCAALPVSMQSTCWKLLYSTDKHESSLRGLYQTTTHRGTANILVLKDLYGAVFGAFSPSALTSNSGYQGSKECFVFSLDLDGALRLSNATPGATGRFIHCRPDSLAFGARANDYALWIDSDLRHGTSNPCFVFGSNCLATSQDFSICDVEVWGL